MFYKHRRTHIYVLEGGERDKREHRHIDIGHNRNITHSIEKMVFYTMMWSKIETTKAGSQKSQNTQTILVFIEKHEYFRL